tara:strand:- start:172 stop:411 length:240 start_codon:yes stop_codon:yes gene_type:complete
MTVHLFRFVIANTEASIVMPENNGYTQKEMINKVMVDIDKLFEKLDQIQKDLATRPTRQEIYGWIIAGISIATLITVLM